MPRNPATKTYQSANYRFSTLDPARGEHTQYYRDVEPGGNSGRLRGNHPSGPMEEEVSPTSLRRDVFFERRRDLNAFHRDVHHNQTSADYYAAVARHGGTFTPKANYFHHEVVFDPTGNTVAKRHRSGGRVTDIAREGATEPENVEKKRFDIAASFVKYLF